ncbi:UNVERIFIED_CONTAM: hypothetical protein Sradi_4368500, partial [Sesamum radiatum]
GPSFWSSRSRRCLMRYCGVKAQSAGLGGPETTVPLAGAKDVPGTTCRAWVLPVVSTVFSLSSALLGVFIVTLVFNSEFPEKVPTEECKKHTGPMNLDNCSTLWSK